MESKLRTTACWLTIAVSVWSLSYYFAYGTKEGCAFIIEDLTVPLISEFDISYVNGSRLIMLIAPVLLVTTVCTLIVTNAPQFSHLSLWINQNIFVPLRSFGGMAGDGLNKKNQYGLGEINFDFLSFCLVSLPCMFFFFATLDQVLKSAPTDLETQQLKLKAIGNALGMAGTLALSFFLIPVARHSVLLVAIGWSPLQALRIHIWAGYTSFVAITLHGLIHFVVWIQKTQQEEEVTLAGLIIPDKICWEWQPTEHPPRECRIQWYNFSGLLAFVFFAILVATSLNWFRRRYYRLFYICHIICGIGMLVGAIMHWRPIITYIAPSLIYYLASTMPALVQALGSRARGGVKVVKVVHLEDAGGCKEIHVSTTVSANTALDTVPSMYVKLCVPNISMIWHPFTVFKHPLDPATVRILFRPVGPFTKALAKRWELEQSTTTILDGFYHAGNRSLEALHHDHVTFYCGGVAITPFLSLIPNLLGEIAKLKDAGEQVNTKKLVFIWACREEGLACYITENYLKGMKQAADAMGFDLDVIVYHTQRKPKKGPLDPMPSKGKGKDNTYAADSDESGDDEDVTSTSNQLDTTFMSELTLDDMRLVESKRLWSSSRSSASPQYSSRSSTPTKSSWGMLNDDDDHEVPSTTHPLLEEEEQEAADKNTSYEVCEYTHEKGAAHDMELHRFMPARHTKVWWNIPATAAIGGSLWLFFYIIFYYYNGYDIYVHEFYDRLWPLIVCVLTSAALGLGVEGIALLVGHNIVVQHKKSNDEDDNDNKRPTAASTSPYLLVDEETMQDAHVEHRCGRPNVTEIFQECRQAECPGIFMCGPPAMTSKVRQEANKENSIFGLTRYALYEDPFEM